MKASSQDIQRIKKTWQNIRVKIQLLSDTLMPEDELSGRAVSVSFNIDSSSQVRRTGTVTMTVEDPSFRTENFEADWINKSVSLYVGFQEGANYVYYILGTMIVSEDAYNYDATTNQLTINLVDLMAYGTQQRGSQIGTEVFIPYNSNVKGTLEATVSSYMRLKGTDITDDFANMTIPYDLSYEIGSYPLDILQGILDLWPTYEHYYDSNGVYTVKEIPTRIDEEVLLDETALDELIISEQRSFNLANVKNSSEVYGRTLTADYVATTCTYSGGIYDVGFLAELQTVSVGNSFSFIPEGQPSGVSPANPRIRFTLTNDGVTTTETYNILDEDGNALEAGTMKDGIAYVVKCVQPDVSQPKSIIFEGQKLIHVIVREMQVAPSQEEMEQDMAANACNEIVYVINPDNPFAVNRKHNDAGDRKSIKAGEMRQVFHGGDYDAITTTSLAVQRAKYENYLKARMNTDVTLVTTLIPFADVNEKIQYTSPITGEVRQYIIKSITHDITGFTTTMQLARFYNYYPF